MDISLSGTQDGTFIEPTSIHGILWLQTHFEANHWKSISEGHVIIPTKDALMLHEDASRAGLNVNFINALAKTDNF